MTIKIQDDQPGELEGRKSGPPPDYFSRGVKLKLFMLVGLLGLVLLMMNEARKPENWTWMGFESNDVLPMDVSDPEDDRDGSFTDVPLPSMQPRPRPETAEGTESAESPGIAEGTDSALSESSSIRETGEPSAAQDSRGSSAPEDDSSANAVGEIEDDGGDRASHAYIPHDPDFEFDSARIQFAEEPLKAQAAITYWRTVFRNYSLANRAQLFRILRYIRNRQVVPEDQVAGFNSMIRELEAGRGDYHTGMLENLAALSDGAVQKPALNKLYFESKELWEQQILPALKSSVTGEDITMQQLESINALQLTLDRFALEEVSDRTSLNQPDEGPAWLRCWETALNPGSLDFEQVTHIELSGQSDAFRGRKVSVSGRVRAARLVRMTRNEIGLDRYYVLWMLPDDTSLSPYCIYATTIPDSFPDIGEATVEMDSAAGVDGVFFKIRPYESAGNEVLFSPMLLASTINPAGESSAATGLLEVPAPDRTGTIIGILMMVLIAGYLAWRGYSVTQMVRRKPDNITSERITRGLELLADDPDIKSDLDNVKSLEEREGLE